MKNRSLNLNKKGFTLVELLAVIILLAIIMGFGSYAVLGIINNNKENNYKLLIDEIYNSVELYYQECRYVNRDDDCLDGEVEITLGNLVNNGYLKGNHEDDGMKLVNTKNNEEITDCIIKFTYGSGKFVIEDMTLGGSCPTTSDYSR